MRTKNQKRNRKALEALRQLRRCEHCRRPTLRPNVHHILRKGMGGGSQLDHPYNLVVLCPPCHDGLVHYSGQLTEGMLIALAARREGLAPDVLEERLRALYRASRKD